MEENNVDKSKTFRDKISYVSDEGRRVWIYSKRPKGKLYNYRMLIGYFLIAIFFVGPFIKINGSPLFLINILERKFIIFTKIFWAQDFYIMFVAMISFIVFILLFTVIYGRIWCGWACPQSVFMELVFRNIEYLFEGSPAQQRKLDAQGLNFEKFIRKFSKHLTFWLISFLMAFTVFSYILGTESMLSIIKDGIVSNKIRFIVLLIFSTVIYLVFSKLRELACTIACPYGRLQGALLDKNSMVVSYDFKRGEPRGKESDGNTGDCIDCKSCVTVCQQGVDIRNGTQLECTNCSACIDACNTIMLKQQKPKGLIRYASNNNIEQGTKFKFTTRVLAYTAVLTLLFSFLVFLLATRTSIETTILRTPGTMLQVQEDGSVSNLYNIKIINKTHEEIPVEIKLISPEGKITMAGGQNLLVKDQNVTEGVFFVNIPKNLIVEQEIEIEIGVYIKNELIDKKTLTFKAE